LTDARLLRYEPSLTVRLLLFMNERYSRQILFPEIGKAGQEKLLNSRVLIVGCGALGASHAEMLARAGVGKLRIVDRDFVEYTNLQRQTLFKESDADWRDQFGNRGRGDRCGRE